MIERGLARFDPEKNRYLPENEIVEIGELDVSEVLKSLFRMTQRELSKRLDSSMDKPHTLFYSSVFSVRKERLPQLAQELQKLLNSFMTTSEDSAGDQLAIISAGMIPVDQSSTD